MSQRASGRMERMQPDRMHTDGEAGRSASRPASSYYVTSRTRAWSLTDRRTIGLSDRTSEAEDLPAVRSFAKQERVDPAMVDGGLTTFRVGVVRPQRRHLAVDHDLRVLHPLVAAGTSALADARDEL